jgi:hypothetical protein
MLHLIKIMRPMKRHTVIGAYDKLFCPSTRVLLPAQAELWFKKKRVHQHELKHNCSCRQGGWALQVQAQVLNRTGLRASVVPATKVALRQSAEVCKNTLVPRRYTSVADQWLWRCCPAHRSALFRSPGPNQAMHWRPASCLQHPTVPLPADSARSCCIAIVVAAGAAAMRQVRYWVALPCGSTVLQSCSCPTAY